MANELNTLFGSALSLASLPGLELRDLVDPPHLLHNSQGAVTMRALTASGKYRVEWGDGAISSLDFGGAVIPHNYSLSGWKRVRFLPESGNPELVTELWPNPTGECQIDARPLRGLLKIEAYNKKLIGIRVEGCRLLSHVKVDSNSLSSATIDQLLIDLDQNGGSNGTLNYFSNPGSGSANRSPQGAQARANLLARGWTITG